jgi:2-keto-4-pentenoate hydratase/2-oxohepta-3-ene-1,7-dioic acid hydratase in catechol pathway
MKLAVRRTYLGDRLCFPGVVPHRLVDVQATYARQLEVGGSHRDDAIARSRDGNTSEMFHSIPEQLCWLTSALTPAPGDILSTGTPPGVRSVQPGDELRGEIDGLGVIENMVVRDNANRRP